MNPDAREFVPSWLSPPPPPPPQQLPEHQNDEAPGSWDDEPVPAASAPTPASVPVSNATDAMASLNVKEQDNAALPHSTVQSKSAQQSISTADKSSASASSEASPASKRPAPTRKSTETAATPSSNPRVDIGSDEAAKAAMQELTGETTSETDRSKNDIPSIEFDSKKPLNVVLLGHVDAGKSTISGHLLVLNGYVDERTMEKYEREAKALNRESWKYAFALDTSEQERAKGKTEECGQASFATANRRFTLLDAPGHKNYVPHMIGGASQADIGILVISARKGEFETGFERGGQTREHAMLAKTSGVRQMIIVVNKLDDPSVLNGDGSWSKERFDECKTKLEPYMRQVGWNPKGLIWIPTSGLTGANLLHKPAEKTCPWYKGKSLLETLETARIPERLLSGSVKMPVNEKHKEMGTMVTGKLESGVIQANDKLTLMPNRVDVVVDALILENTSAQAAEPGDVVRLRLKGVEEEDVRVGFVLCSPRDLVSYSRSFIAKLMILEHKSIICAGYSAVIHIHAAVEEITVTKLLAEIDKSNKPKRKYPKFVKPGMKVLAQLTTSMPICVEPYDVFPQLGRFMIRDEGKTIAVGTVAKVKQTEATQRSNDSSAQGDGA